MRKQPTPPPPVGTIKPAPPPSPPKPFSRNPLKLYQHAPRLLDIAREYREHIVCAATEDEDMSLVDEIDQIISEVEGS